MWATVFFSALKGNYAMGHKNVPLYLYFLIDWVTNIAFQLFTFDLIVSAPCMVNVENYPFWYRRCLVVDELCHTVEI